MIGILPPFGRANSQLGEIQLIVGNRQNHSARPEAIRHAVRTGVLLVAALTVATCGAEEEPLDVSESKTEEARAVVLTPTATPVPDSDMDGLPDPEEARLGTNPFQRDSDVDGIDDGDEVRLGSDPLFPDTDRDGVVDGDEVQLGIDPLRPDTDRDGVADGDEIQLGSDPLHPDTDRDGVADGDEIQLGSDPLHPDTDRDGVADGDEIQLGSDPLHPDTDRDGVADGDDVLPLHNAKVRVSIIEFIDKSQRGILHGDTNAFFTIYVGDAVPVITPVYSDVQNQRIDPIVVDVDDSWREIAVAVLAQEHAPLAGFFKSAVITYITGLPIQIESDGQPYDTSGTDGPDLDAKVLLTTVAANSSSMTTGDGTDDDDQDVLEAKVTVTVEHGSY